MSYTVYTVRALVMRHMDDGETGRAYFLLTDDYGVILATAQGIRREGSKLRAALSLWSLVHVSMVRGKYGWKIVSAAEEGSVYRKLAAEHIPYVARMADFTKRLLSEDAAQGHFLTSFLKAADLLINQEDHSDFEKREAVRLLYCAHIAHALGYLNIAPFSGIGLHESTSWTSATLQSVLAQKALLRKSIENALSVSHL